VNKMVRLLVLPLILVVPGFAADVTGTWTYERQGRDGTPQTTTLTLRADGSKLTGSISVGGRDQEISDGQVDGNSLHFSVGANRFDGTLEGDTLTLRITNAQGKGGRGGPVTVTAHRRCPPDCR
jgi:hypothetical protein